MGGYVAAAAAIIGAVSQIMQGNAQQQAYNVQADQYLKQGELDIQKLQKDTSRLKGTQKVAMAANGNLDSTTAQDIALDTITQEKLDEMIIREQARLRADMARAGGNNAALAGGLNATTSLLSSASQYAF